MSLKLKNKMDTFINKTIKPLRERYLLVAGLIVIFSLLKDAFQESPINYILLGLILSSIVFILITIIYKTFKASLVENNANLVSMLYSFVLIIFGILFLINFYLIYDKVFLFMCGMLLAIFLTILFSDIRIYLIILQNKLNSKLIKKLIRIIFLITFCILSNFIINYSVMESGYNLETNTWEEEITSYEIFFITFMFIFSFTFLIGFIILFIDVFRKNPLYSKKYKWERTKLSILINKLKNWVKLKINSQPSQPSSSQSQE